MEGVPQFSWVRIIHSKSANGHGLALCTGRSISGICGPRADDQREVGIKNDVSAIGHEVSPFIHSGAELDLDLDLPIHIGSNSICCASVGVVRKRPVPSCEIAGFVGRPSQFSLQSNSCVPSSATAIRAPRGTPRTQARADPLGLK